MFRMKDLRPDQIMEAPTRVVKSSYTKEENYRAYKLFSMMDIDGGGSISLRELNRVMMGDMQRYVTCEFKHPDTGIIFGVDEEQCVMITSIEPDSMASKYPFLIPRMRLHRINSNFYVKPYDARALQAVYQQLLRLHDEPVALEFYEPIIVLNKFSCMLDLEVNNEVFSVSLPVGAVYNHHLFCEKIMELMRQSSPMLQFIELKFIPNRRQVIFLSDVAEFRLLFATGPNYRRSCRYALGFSAEDLPYANEHQGQPMLMDLRLGLAAEQMDVLMKELFTLYDEDGSGEFEFEEFRDFYIQYLDTEESLDRLRYYAQFRFRDIERETYVKKLQNERTNKLQRREVLKVKYARVMQEQRNRLLEDSYVDKYGLRRRNYRHRTNDRLNYERLQYVSKEGSEGKEYYDTKSGKLIVGLDKAKISTYSSKTSVHGEDVSIDRTDEDDHENKLDHDLETSQEDLDDIPPLMHSSVAQLNEQSDVVRSSVSQVSEITVDEEAVVIRRKFASKSKRQMVSSIKNDSHVSVPLTRDELMHEKRKAKKEKQYHQYLRRQKILAKILEANKALKKLERAKARAQQLSHLSTQLMELHYLVKHAILNSVRIENVEEFDMMKAFSLNIHGIVASPGVNFTSAILGQHLEPSSLDVENLPSTKMHPAGSYYYFLRDTHYQAAMTTKRHQLATSFSIDPTRGKNDRVESIGNPEFMHPAFFTADFVRQPTRHSNIALSYGKIMKRKMHEGVEYRMEHGIKKRYDHIPPEDIIVSTGMPKVKKVRFLDVAPSQDTEFGKLIGRVTIKSIKVMNIPSIHVLERNSPFVKLECGPWKFTTEVYSYAGEYCEWDDLDWMFRIYEPHYLTITACSGTVTKNLLIGKSAISTPDLITLPRDQNGYVIMNGYFTDPDHPHKVKLFGEFEMRIFLEPGQEWQWYIRAHEAKQDHKKDVKHQMMQFSKTLGKSNSGLYGDVVSLPFILQIMSISLFDLKTPVESSIFGSTWLSKASLSSLYLVLDTGNQERSTVDYQSAANKQLDATSIEWDYLYWDISVLTYDMNFIFKVFSKSGAVGRFVLNATEIVSKLSKGMIEVEYYGDVKNFPSTDEVTGKIHVKCNVLNSMGRDKKNRAKLMRDPQLESEQNDDMSVTSGITSSVQPLSSVTIRTSHYDRTGYVPGDLIYLMLPLIWEVDSIEIKLSEGYDIAQSRFFRTLTTNKSKDVAKHIKLSLSLDTLQDLKVAYPVICSETSSLSSTSPGKFEQSSQGSPRNSTKIGNTGSTVLNFDNLKWNLPLRENMRLSITLSINSRELGVLHIHSNEFYSFKKNVLANGTVLVYRFMNNGKEICGNVKIRGRVSCEQDEFYVSRKIELLEKDYHTRQVEQSSDASIHKKETIENLKSETAMLAGLLDKVKVVPGIIKTDQPVKSLRTGIVMIEKDECPLHLSAPVLLLNHNSTNPQDVSFPVIATIFEVMVTDLRAVHLFKKNAPQATVACGVNALSTKPLNNNGSDGVWTGLNYKFTFDNINQQLRVHIKSYSTSIGECALSAHELIEVRPDNTGMREIFAHLVIQSDAALQNSKSNVQILGSISKGKVKLSYFLHSHINPLPVIQEVPRQVLEVSRNRFVEYPIAITIYDMTLLNLKSVHLFNKNSPFIKLARTVGGLSEDLFESSPVTFAGSYAKWMNLMWHFIVVDERSSINLQVSSESIVVGKAMIRANKFLSSVPDKVGICDLEFPLTSGKSGEFPSGIIRFTFTYEPHVPDEDMLGSDAMVDAIVPAHDLPALDGQEEGRSQSSVSTHEEDVLVTPKKRKREPSKDDDKAPLASLVNFDSKQARSVLIVAMSVILNINSESSNTTKFLVHSLLKHKVIRVHLSCGSYFGTAELMETVNESVLSNINLLEKFMINIETPLKLKIYDPRGRLLGESVFQWDDFTKSNRLIDNYGYAILEQEFIRIDEDYHEVLGLLRIKVKISHVPKVNNINIKTDQEGVDPNQDVLKQLYKVAPSVDIPFHLKVKKLTVFDLLVDSEMKKSMESLSSHKQLGLQLQYEQMKWFMLGKPSDGTNMKDKVVELSDGNTVPDFQNIDFLDDSLLFTVTNEFETWRLFFSLFPFQNVLVGEVLIQVSDWQQALLRNPGPDDDPNLEIREVFTNIFKRTSKGSSVIVGRVCIHFQLQEISFRSMFNTVSPTKKNLKKDSNVHETLNSLPVKLQDPVGYLRVKSIAVGQLRQVYALFKNSPKVTLTAGTEFEGITDTAWEAGSEHRWENLQWGKINLYEGMPLKFKVTSANEVIGTCVIQYKSLLQRVLTRSTSSKSIMLITESLRDGRFVKGKIEISCFLSMKITPMQQLIDLPPDILSLAEPPAESKVLGTILENGEHTLEKEEENALVSELIRRVDQDDMVDSELVGIDSLDANFNGNGSSSVSSGHFDGITEKHLSDNTPSPANSEVVFLSLALFDLANPPETVYRNSPQALFSCGDWRSYTDVSLFAGKNANWLFPRNKEWKLKVKGSPYVKISVMTNNYLLGISCFNIRDMAAVETDELGISKLTRELHSSEGKYSGIVEVRFVLYIAEESKRFSANLPDLKETTKSMVMLDHSSLSLGNGLDNQHNSLISQESQNASHCTVVNSAISDVLPNGNEAIENIEWPLALKVLQIYVEDIPNQHWFVDNSLSVKLKTMTDLKLSSIQTNSGAFATWDDLNWDFRIHSKDDYLGLILSSGNKIVGTLKFTIKDILARRKSRSHGYFEVSRKLQVKANATLETSIEHAHGKVTICLQIANIPSRQKKEKLLEICNKYFSEVSNESYIIGMIQPKLITLTGISKMYHDCFMTMVVGASKKQHDDSQNGIEDEDMPAQGTSPIQEKTEMMKNWSGNMIFNVENWKVVKIYDRLFIVFYLESKTNELIGSLSLSAFQIMTAPIDDESRLAVVYGDLMIGLNSHGKFSITFERLDYDNGRPPKAPILIDEVGDIERPIVWKIEQGKSINIVQVTAFSLTSIHKTGRNSPLLTADYRGLKYMTDSIPFGGDQAEWNELNWPIDCRDTGALKLKITSCSVEIGTATVLIKDLYELPLNEFGECEVEKPLTKGKQQRGVVRVQFYLVESKLAKAKRRMKALESPGKIEGDQESNSQSVKSVITHISEVEELHNRILAENIEQFKKLFAQKRLFKSRQDATEDGATISSFSLLEDGSLSRPDGGFGEDQSMETETASFKSQSLIEFSRNDPPTMYSSTSGVSFGENITHQLQDDVSSVSRYSSSVQSASEDLPIQQGDKLKFSSSKVSIATNSISGEMDASSRSVSFRPKTSRGDSVEPPKELPKIEIRPILSGSWLSGSDSSVMKDHSLLSSPQSATSNTGPLVSILEDKTENVSESAQLLSHQSSSFHSRPSSGYSRSSDSRPSTGYSSYSEYSTYSGYSDYSESTHHHLDEPSFTDKNSAIKTIYSHPSLESSRPVSGHSDASSSEYFSNTPSTGRSSYSTYSDYSDFSTIKKEFPYDQPDDDFRGTSRSPSASRPLTGVESTVFNSTTSEIESLMEFSEEPPEVNQQRSVDKSEISKLIVESFSNEKSQNESQLVDKSVFPVSRKRTIQHIFDLQGLQWIPSPVIDIQNIPVPKLDTQRITLITAETFVNTIVDSVLSSFVAMSLGQDFDPKSFHCHLMQKQKPDQYELMPCKVIPITDWSEDDEQSPPWRLTLLSSLEVVKHVIRFGATYALSAIVQDVNAARINEKKQEHMRFLKRGGILMKRLDSPEYNLKGQGLLSSYKDNEDDFHVPLEKYYKKGVEAKFIPIKAKFTIEDIIGLDLGGIDMRIMPTRPYLTACRPGGNWAAETNPLKINLQAANFNKETDLLLNFYNLHTKFRWESFIMRRGQVVQLDLHDAGSGLIIGKCILSYEEILDTFPEKQHEFDSTIYLQFQVANEFGGGQIGGVMRVHVDLTVNLFSRCKKKESYWDEHRAQHWKHFPLTPICFGVVRQQFKEIAEAYDQQRVVHPAFYGFKVRMRGNMEDESKFIHPIFQGFFLSKKVFDSKVMSGKDIVTASAMKSLAGNPFRWDPTAHERNQCPVCVNGLVGCPRCFMMPTRAHDGLYFAPGEFAYDPDEERAKKLLQEQRMIKLATKKARKLAAIQWMADMPQLPPTKTEKIIEGTQALANNRKSDNESDDDEDTSLTSQSVYSQLTQQIEKEYEEELSQVMLTAEKAKVEKPPFHTNLTTYKSLRLYRIKVLCQVNVFVKVLPAGYIRRITCESKETIFQLYSRFNSQSAWGNSYNSRMLLPTSVGLFELFPDLAVESDLMMADNRGHDRLEEFYLNEQNATYVLLFFKNYHAANVTGTLQGYFNKNTEHIIPRIPIYNGVDKLPSGKISKDPVQVTLRNMVLSEYELQQKDVVNEFLALGKSFRSSKEAQRQIEAAQEKMKAKFIEDEKNAMKQRLRSQIKQLKDLTPRSKQKAIEKLFARENDKKKSRLLRGEGEEGTTSSSKSGSASISNDETISLSGVLLDDDEDGDEDEEGQENQDNKDEDGEGDEATEESAESLMTRRSSQSVSTHASDYDTASDHSQTDGSSTARSNVSMSDIDVEERSGLENQEPEPFHAAVHVAGSSVVSAVQALKQSKNINESNIVTMEGLHQYSKVDVKSFFEDQDRLEELFSRSECSGSLQDKDYYSQDGSEWDEDDENDDDYQDDQTSRYSQSQSYASHSRTGTASTQWSDYSESQRDTFSNYSSYPNTSRSTYSDYGSESVYSVDGTEDSLLDDRSRPSTGRSSRSTGSTGSSASFYSSTSFFTEGLDEETQGGESSHASTTGSSLFPLDRIATQSYHLSKSQVQVPSIGSFHESVPRLPGPSDGDSVGIYSHQYSRNDDSLDSVTTHSSHTLQSRETLEDSNEGLFTYRSNISTSTKASDISLVPSPHKLSHLSAESISKYASILSIQQKTMNDHDGSSLYSERSRGRDDSMSGSSTSDYSDSNPSSRATTARSDYDSKSATSASIGFSTSDSSQRSSLYSLSKSSLSASASASTSLSRLSGTGSESSFSQSKNLSQSQLNHARQQPLPPSHPDPRMLMSKSLTSLHSQGNRSITSVGSASTRYAGYGYIDDPSEALPTASLSASSLASLGSQSKFVQKHINIAKISESLAEGSLARVDEALSERSRTNSTGSHGDQYSNEGSRPSSSSSYYSVSSHSSDYSKYSDYSDRSDYSEYSHDDSRYSDYQSRTDSRSSGSQSGDFSARSYYSSDYTSGSYSARSDYQSTVGSYSARSDRSSDPYSDYSDDSRRSSIRSNDMGSAREEEK